MLRTRGVLAAAAALLLTLAGCGGSSRRGPIPGRWARTDFLAVSQPIGIGGRFIVLTATPRGLRVVALDARSGSTVWSDAATPTETAPGVTPSLLLEGGDVIYPRLERSGLAQLVSVDAATGATVWRGAKGVFTAWPSSCLGRRQAVCISGVPATRHPGFELLSYDAATGRALRPLPLTRGARQLTLGLFDGGARNPERLLAVAAGRSEWSQPLARIFTLAHASTDWGWNIERDGALGLFVGSVGVKPMVLTAQRFVSNLSLAMTAGFRTTDGSVAWRAPGQYECVLLPCPGDSPSASPGVSTGAALTVALLLRQSGTETGVPSVAKLGTLSAGATSTLAGVDPASGRTLWSAPLGTAGTALAAGRFPPQTSAQTIVVPAGARLSELNLRTGATRPIKPGAPAWCRALTSYREPSPYRTSSGFSVVTYYGQPSITPCTAEGGAVPVPRHAPGFVGAIGAETGGVVAWSGRQGVVARPAG